MGMLTERPKGPEWGGVLGEGQRASSPPARESRGAVQAPQRRSGQSPRKNEFGAFWDFSGIKTV